MLEAWREGISADKAHFRQLSGLPGTEDDGWLPIEHHTDSILASIKRYAICGVRSPPGSGKTMILPEVLRNWAVDEAKGRRQELNQAVMIVFPTQFGCLKIRDSLLEFRGHHYWTVNLRTGVDKDDRFRWEHTKFQVVTYGMLWQWLVKGGQETCRNLFEQNCAFLLDEFSGKAAGGDPLELAADPQTMEIARLLAGFVRENSGTHRLLVTGASLDQHLLNAVLPEAEFLTFTGRMYPLERCIIAPRNIDEILTLCAELISITIGKDTGNLLVFLPGMDDILRLDKLVKQKLGRRADGVNIVRLHSHLLGEGETSQENAETSSAGEGRQLYLSSLIAARGVTLPDIKYVFIHPYNRTTFLHQSGLETLGNERITGELIANETGRAGRTAAGKVVYLFEFDDSEEALLKLEDQRGAKTHSRQQGVRMHPGAPSARCRSRSPARSSATHPVPLRAPPSGQVPQQQHATLILGPPSRLPYIQATMRQLQEKGFPNILWLRLPDPLELDEFLKRTLPPQRRVMALWRTTVLPAVLQVCDTYACTGAMVVEDTVLLRQDVTYEDVVREIQQRNAPAGVWGYGHYWEKRDPEGTIRHGWSGTKGLWMTPAWCEEISLRMENTNFENYKHVDMWLVDLLKEQKAQGFALYSVLAGYGHRVSMSTGAHGVQKFGGCDLPESPQERPLDEREKDEYIFQYSPPGIQDWVLRCKEELGRTPRRGDVVDSELYLELPAPGAYPKIGLYTESQSARVRSQETAARYELVMSLPPPSFVETDFRRPPEPPVVPHIGTDLGKLWEVYVAREERAEQEFAELPRSATQLAKWKFGAATKAVKSFDEAKLPLSPQWQHFAKLCRGEDVGAEGLNLAVFFSEGPWTFDVRLVAPTWVEAQVWWDGDGRSDQERDEFMQRSLLFIYSRILPDLESFLQAVDEQDQKRREQRRPEGMDDCLAEIAETLMEPLKQQELTVPRKRLKKAKSLLEKCKWFRPEVIYRRPEEKHNLLVTNLSRACPAWVAHADEDACPASSERKWYAAACRVRGAALQAINRGPHAHGNPSQVLLLQPRIQPYQKKKPTH